MLKIACIFSFKKSEWVSCQKIVFNLHEVYQTAGVGEIENFNLSSEMREDDIFDLSKKIAESSPDLILIIDHKPHPLGLLMNLLPQLKKKPRMIFHLFGDFTLYLKEWYLLGTYLEGLEVTFVVASEAQKRLVDKFLDPRNACAICPFPILETDFSYLPKLRGIQRSEWELGPNDVAFVFTGRLSYQKNIHTLMNIFAKVAETNPQAHLFLYGNPDHIGDPFLAKWEMRGEYFRKLHRLWYAMPEVTRSRVHFMGSVSSEELKSVYQGADWLINLSTHNDEDYGMSVAEAMCSGLPSILTSWGGFQGFACTELPMASQFIPVTLNRNSKDIDLNKLEHAMRDSVSMGSFIYREGLSLYASERFSTQACRQIIRDILSKPTNRFETYSKFFKDFVIALRLNLLEAAYLTEEKELSPLYRELYSAYVTETTNSI